MWWKTSLDILRLEPYLSRTADITVSTRSIRVDVPGHYLLTPFVVLFLSDVPMLRQWLRQSHPWSIHDHAPQSAKPPDPGLKRFLGGPGLVSEREYTNTGFDTSWDSTLPCFAVLAFAPAASHIESLRLPPTTGLLRASDSRFCSGTASRDVESPSLACPRLRTTGYKPHALQRCASDRVPPRARTRPFPSFDSRFASDSGKGAHSHTAHRRRVSGQERTDADFAAQ
ncbi:hypothetical protein B0H13DRAFT_2371725 [Mycena leptocephala]|nr:hypothetical protein B0H13DRAFT_2371725 [Mycena leptocephala]